MQSREPQNRFKQLVHSLHWQVYETFVDVFDRTAQAMAIETGEASLRTVSVSRRQLDRWLSGDLKSLPRPRQCRVLERMLGESASSLFNTGSAPARALSLHEQALTAAKRAADFTIQDERNNLSSFAIAEVEANADRLIRQYPNRPLVELFPSLTDTQAQVFELLSNCRDPETQRRLYRASAIVTALLSKASHDLGDADAALTQGRAALLSAERASDTSLLMWIHSLQSLASFWAEDYDACIRYADSGLKIALEGVELEVWLLCLKGRAYASLKEEGLMRSAFQKARDIRGRLEATSEPYGGLMRFPPWQQSYYEAEAFVIFDRTLDESYEKAMQAMQDVASAPEDQKAFGSEAGARCALASMQIYRGDISEAKTTMSPVLDSDPNTHINGVMKSVLRVSDALKHLDDYSSEALELQQRIASFSGLNLGRLPTR